MADLAIKGHATRGREVIALLKMLGGKNIYNLTGTKEIWHILSDNTINHSSYLFEEKGFSLEELLEKYPYKVGDKVKDAIIEDYVGTIIEAQWDNYEEEMVYTVIWDNMKELNYFAKDLRPYKEETMEGKLISKEELSLKIDTSQMEKRRIIFSADAPNETELVLGDNFEIKVEDGKTYVVKKKPQYPKSYYECCEVLNCKANHFFTNFSYNGCYIEISDCEREINNLLQSFRELIYCRDAYWKIAGDWKPNWKSDEDGCNTIKFCIKNFEEEIVRRETSESNTILAFPTEEMRDIFYENFKELIENCKELL